MLQTNIFRCNSEIIVSQMLKQVILTHAEKFFIPPKIVTKNCQSNSYQLNASVVNICLAKHSEPSVKLEECQQSKPLTLAFKVRKTPKFVLKSHKIEEFQEYNSLFQLTQSKIKLCQNLHNNQPLSIQKYNNRISLKESTKDQHKRSFNIRNSFCFKDTANSYFFNKATVRELFELRCQEGNAKDQKIERILRKNKLNTEKNMKQVKNYILNCPSKKVIEQKNSKSLNILKNSKSISTHFDGSVVNLLKNINVCESKSPIQMTVQIHEGEVNTINSKVQSSQFLKLNKNQKALTNNQFNQFCESKFLHNFSSEDEKAISNAKIMTNKMKSYKKQKESYVQRLKNIPGKISMRTFQNIKHNKDIDLQNEEKEKLKQLNVNGKIKNQNSLLHSKINKNKPNFILKTTNKTVKQRKDKKQLIQISNNKSFQFLFGNESFHKEKRLRFAEN